MTSLITVTGTFKNDPSVVDCLGYLGRLSIPVENMSVSGLDSGDWEHDTWRFTTGFAEFLFIAMLSLAGATAAAAIVFCANRANAQLELLFGWLMGCAVASVLLEFPLEKQDAENARGKVEIAIRVSQLSEQNAIKAIMQEFGAVVTLKAPESEACPKLEPPPLLPS